MQNVKDSFLKGFSSFCLVSIIVVSLGISGCENPGSVGDGLTDSGAEVVVDTMNVENIATVQSNSYAGGLSYFSAGQYDDQLFGNMSVTGMVKPSLPANADSVQENDAILLRVILNGEQVYGDSLASQNFDIYRIDELWRSNARHVYDDIKIDESEKIASFSVEEQDSIDVPLSQSWYDEYYSYVSDTTDEADSLYKYQSYGLALVPSNSEKIIPLSASSTRFVLQNQDADTSYDVGLNQWAYSLDRSNESIPEGSQPLYSTYENVLNFDLNLSDLDIQTSTLSRVELIFYQNNEAMEQSLESEPRSVSRANEASIRLDLAEPDEVPENIDPGNPLLRGAYDETDGAYHFDITAVAQQLLLSNLPENQKFYITFSNDGIIKPSLLYVDSDQVPADKRPKIVITHLKNTNK